MELLINSCTNHAFSAKVLVCIVSNQNFITLLIHKNDHRTATIYFAGIEHRGA